MSDIATVFLDLHINDPHNRAEIVINTLNADFRQHVKCSPFLRIDDLYAFIYVAEVVNTSPGQVEDIINESYALTSGEEIFMMYRYELDGWIFKTFYGNCK